MLPEIVKDLFAKTLQTDTTDTFEFKKINEWTSVFISLDLDVLITYDEREDEIYIDLDLLKYFRSKNYPTEFQFPLHLNVDIIYEHLKVLKDDSKAATLEERLKLKSSQFLSAWNELLRMPNYKEILSDLLKNQRNKLNAQNELKHLQKLLDLAHVSFKTKDYKRTIDLLNPVKDQLGEYEKKILEYSLKRERL